MEKTTNYSEGKITIEMNFEEEAAIQVAIIGEIIGLKRKFITTNKEISVRMVLETSDKINEFLK